MPDNNHTTRRRQQSGRISRCVLLLFVAYFVLAAVLAARWYGSTEATIVCSACLAVSVALGLCLRLSDAKRSKIALASTSLLFSLYVCEGFYSAVKFLQNGNKQSAANTQSVADFDTRSITEVLEDMKSTGIEAVPTVAPEMFTASDGLPTERGRVFPIGGVAKKRTLLGNENGSWAYYESDEYGFNNPSPQTETDVDIVLIGDSFAQGVAVQPGEDIGARLRSDKRRVTNLGTSGNGPLIELATLKEYAEPLKPLVVLWFYYEENDLFNLRNEQQSPLLLRYLDPEFTQGLRSRQSEIDSALTHFIQCEAQRYLLKPNDQAESSLASFAKLSHLRGLARAGYQRRTWRQDKTDLVPYFREIMEQAKYRTESWGGKLYFVYLPCWNRYGLSYNEGHYHREDVLRAVRDLDIPTIDIHDAVEKLDDPLSIFPFRKYGHYNASGYKLVAEQVHNVITPTILAFRSAKERKR